MESNFCWVIIRIPLNVPKIWGTRGRLRVKGEVNGFAFRSALFPTGKGYHCLLVNKRMQAGAQARMGDTVHFQLEPDLEKRKVIVPSELKRALSEDRSLVRWFHALSYSIRKWIAEWVLQPKGAESRVRRAQHIAEQLLSTMEAERELPPILNTALARDPRALQGWQLMCPTRRRSELLSIFHYRYPESRNRRVAKTVQEALALAEQTLERG